MPAVLRGSAHAILVGRRTARAGGGGDPSPETRLDRASTRCRGRSSRVTPSLTLTTARFPFVLPEPPAGEGRAVQMLLLPPRHTHAGRRPPALWIPARGGMHRTRRAASERGEGGSAEQAAAGQYGGASRSSHAAPRRGARSAPKRHRLCAKTPSLVPRHVVLDNNSSSTIDSSLKPQAAGAIQSNSLTVEYS